MTEPVETLWDKMKKTLTEIYEAGREKAEEITKLGKVKLEIFNIKRQITSQFSELGGMVYHLIVETKTTHIAGNDRVKALVKKIQTLEDELKRKEEEIKEVRVEEAPKTGTSKEENR